MNNSSIYWFKNDQRLLDNEALCRAIAFGQPVLPVYIIDPRLFNTYVYGERKTDYARFLFLIQSLSDLKKNLLDLGADLDIHIGHPEAILSKLVNRFSIDQIYCESEYASEELKLINSVEKSIGKGCSIQSYWGKTLYHLNDIPYTIKDFPKTSKTFRINTGKTTEVRKTFAKIAPFATIKNYQYGEIPSATDLGFKADEIIPEIAPYMDGGETKALKRLNYYTFGSQLLTSYKWSRNKSQGLDYSSKLSPYLALGNISPRIIYEAVKLYENTIKKNTSTWWLVFEVVWRDYFTFKGMHHEDAIFRTEGFSNKIIEFENNETKFTAWKKGVTGIPFIDAHMRQLNSTGYMSNRGRVNCASFLIHDLKIDWTWGASYFETKLIDYDVSANWMNWHMQAYEIWYTNAVNQGQKYKAGSYIKEYIPELNHLNENEVLAPWLFDSKSYPEPIVMFSKWTRAINIIKKHNDIKH